MSGAMAQRALWIRAAWVAVLCGAVCGEPQPAWAQESPHDLLALHCQGLRASRSACVGLQQSLRARAANEVIESRLARARRWIAQPARQRRAEAIVRGRRAPAINGTTAARVHADYGMALLAAGRYGDGMQHLLVAANKQPNLSVAADGAYLGLMLIWPELEAEQQVDWAKDLAGRLSGLFVRVTAADGPAEFSRRPRVVELLRLIALYRLGDERSAANYFAKLGEKFYPKESVFREQAGR